MKNKTATMLTQLIEKQAGLTKELIAATDKHQRRAITLRESKEAYGSQYALSLIAGVIEGKNDAARKGSFIEQYPEIHEDKSLAVIGEAASKNRLDMARLRYNLWKDEKSVLQMSIDVATLLQGEI